MGERSSRCVPSQSREALAATTSADGAPPKTAQAFRDACPPSFSVSHKRHVVICLGQSLLDGGRVPAALEHRLAHACAVYKRLSAEEGGAYLYVSGADVAGRGRYKPEGHVMFENLQQQGVDAGDIDVDTSAFNTIENFANAIASIRARNAVATTLVTSDFHSPRAEYIAKTVFAARGAQDVKLMVDPAPSGLAAGAIRPRLPREINDYNLLERIEHETQLMKRRMVHWLLQYECPTDQAPRCRTLLVSGLAPVISSRRDGAPMACL